MFIASQKGEYAYAGADLAKIIESEVISKKYFESLGFTIRARDFDGKKKGADFFIEQEGCLPRPHQQSSPRTRLCPLSHYSCSRLHGDLAYG